MNDLIEPHENPLLAERMPPAFGAIDPAHVRPAVGQILLKGREELGRLAAAEAPSVEWLRETERLLERIHDVWNPVAHLNSVASSPELRAAYNDCLAEITAFFSELGQNEALFGRFQALASSIRSEPEAELVRQSLRDFRLAGVALEGEAKEAYRAVSLELAAKQAEFEQNIMDATDAFEHHETNETKLAGLPEQVLSRARSTAAEKELPGWLLKLDPPTYQSVMTHADDAVLRERYYRAWVTRASDQGESEWDNGPLIEDILRLRQEQAELLGYENFAALSLARKMADSETEVLDFLEGLAGRSRHFAEAEFARLEQFAGRALAAHDVAYFSEKLKQQTLSIGDEELRAYFPVPRVLA